MEPNYAFARNMTRKILKDYELSEVPTDLSVKGSNLRLTYVRKRGHSYIVCFAQNLKAFSSCAIYYFSQLWSKM